jgi:hypothetical protein
MPSKQHNSSTLATQGGQEIIWRKKANIHEEYFGHKIDLEGYVEVTKDSDGYYLGAAINGFEKQVDLTQNQCLTLGLGAKLGVSLSGSLNICANNVGSGNIGEVTTELCATIIAVEKCVVIKELSDKNIRF